MCTDQQIPSDNEHAAEPHRSALLARRQAIRLPDLVRVIWPISTLGRGVCVNASRAALGPDWTKQNSLFPAITPIDIGLANLRHTKLLGASGDLVTICGSGDQVVTVDGNWGVVKPAASTAVAGDSSRTSQ